MKRAAAAAKETAKNTFRNHWQRKCNSAEQWNVKFPSVLSSSHWILILHFFPIKKLRNLFATDCQRTTTTAKVVGWWLMAGQLYTTAIKYKILANFECHITSPGEAPEFDGISRGIPMEMTCSTTARSPWAINELDQSSGNKFVETEQILIKKSIKAFRCWKWSFVQRDCTYKSSMIKITIISVA